MKVMKRDGSEVDFDIEKIKSAVKRANEEKQLKSKEKLTNLQIEVIAENVYNEIKFSRISIPIEQIQDLVIENIMKQQAYKVAQLYTEYRYLKSLHRDALSSAEKSVISLVKGENQDSKEENSNKNTVIESTQRDYIAGLTSKAIAEKVIIPPEVVEAHNQGIIHYHDQDYAIQTIHNCDLINLDDMLQNGTAISGIQIVKPHSLRTAMNVSTQIVAQVASSQYGGQTISLAHISPFIEVSRKKIAKELKKELKSIGVEIEK